MKLVDLAKEPDFKRVWVVERAPEIAADTPVKIDPRIQLFKYFEKEIVVHASWEVGYEDIGDAHVAAREALQKEAQEIIALLASDFKLNLKTRFNLAVRDSKAYDQYVSSLRNIIKGHDLDVDLITKKLDTQAETDAAVLPLGSHFYVVQENLQGAASGKPYLTMRTFDIHERRYEEYDEGTFCNAVKHTARCGVHHAVFIAHDHGDEMKLTFSFGSCSFMDNETVFFDKAEAEAHIAQRKELLLASVGEKPAIHPALTLDA